VDTRFADLVADCAFKIIIINQHYCGFFYRYTNFKCLDIKYVKNSNRPLGSLHMSFATVSKEEEDGRGGRRRGLSAS
jgi:hypothetical protein